jgi:hypothetical protein
VAEGERRAAGSKPDAAEADDAALILRSALRRVSKDSGDRLDAVR